MDKPLVSVVVPTFNSERFLERCLRSIKEQIYPNIEVVMVDSYSVDRTRKIAKSWGIRVVLCKAGRSRARNVGAVNTKGEFVLFVDSDMELTPNVVGECIAKAESGVEAIIIPELSIGEGYWAQCRALEKLCYIGDDLIEATRFLKRDVFEAVEGYDVDLLFGEDWDLNARIKENGCKIGRIRAFIKHHEGRLSLREDILKKHFYGKTLRSYFAKHQEEANYQLSLIRPAFVKNWKKLAKDPSHTLGMVFMKTCEFIATYVSL